MTHIDVFREGDGTEARVLALTYREPSNLLYAQSPIVTEAGWSGGSYDPPSVRSVLVHENVASA